uniref:Uncharacterized protein n=1 Tax=Romanomermis culicivorax TaxID=13658 RepID=A0A915KD56_ROMCU
MQVIMINYRRRCLREEELGRMVNKRYALEQVHRNQQLDAYRAQCMGTPEEAVLQFCWSLGRPANCGCINLIELRTWVAVGDDMLIRCRQQRLVGGPFPIMTADDNRRYSLNSSGIFIRCTNHGILVARQWCGRNFMIREVDERELHQWYEIGGMELSVYDCDPSKGPFSGYPL